MRRMMSERIMIPPAGSGAAVERSPCFTSATRIGVSSRGLEILRTLDDVFAALGAGDDEQSGNDDEQEIGIDRWQPMLREPQRHAT
jgi:hypothetical protein